MLIIGIAGGTGSGKTTLVHQIKKNFSSEKVCVISQDSYYKSTDHLSDDERSKINFDHPNAIDFELLVAQLKQLKSGINIAQPIYSFLTHNRTKDVVNTSATRVVIVEGILIFNHEELRNLFDIKLFVHVDSDERLVRRIRRDISERGRSIDDVLHRYKQTLKPMHMQFVEPTKTYADIIIPNDKKNTGAIEIITLVIRERI